VNGRESVEGGLKRNLKKKEREILKKSRILEKNNSDA